VTLAWACSADGALAAARGAPTALSGARSLRLTHALRARHAAILVGVATVLADDPSLTVRLVAGDSPRPVVLDPALRTPLGSRLARGARERGLVLLARADRLADADVAARRAALEAAGALVVALPPAPPPLQPPRAGQAHEQAQAQAPAGAGAAAGDRVAEAREVDLCAAAAALKALGLASLMVEGGARVLESFLRQHGAAFAADAAASAAAAARGRGGAAGDGEGGGDGDGGGGGGAGLVDQVVLTVAPLLLGGGVRLGGAAAGAQPLRVGGGRWHVVGEDVVLQGSLSPP
jgi:riboflavin biosynthesis pyrimidine reductase